MLMLPPFSLLRPATVGEALEALSEDSVAYCGGTELLLAMRAGLQRPTTLVDIKRLPDLSGIRVDEASLIVGATVTHAQAAGHELVRQHAPMFAAMEAAIGNARVRAQGSVGGNLCFCEPKSDVATALIALDASVSLVAADGSQRSSSVEDFIVGPYETNRKTGELLTAVRIPLRPRHHAVYAKYQTRERPTVGIALVSTQGKCRLVVGAVGEMPMSWTFDGPGEIVPEEVAAQIDPVPDLTGSVHYLRQITTIYVRRAVQELARVQGS
jgi:carbon-monoxide dehydrogenase medium subunit